MKAIISNIQSISDLITNSSSECFICHSDMSPDGPEDDAWQITREKLASEPYLAEEICEALDIPELQFTDETSEERLQLVDEWCKEYPKFAEVIDAWFVEISNHRDWSDYESFRDSAWSDAICRLY